MAKSSDWMISPSDFFFAVKREYKRIALLFLLFAFFGFLYALFHPLHYTAHGIFRTKNNAPSFSLPSSLSQLGSTLSSQEDSKVLIDSFPLFVQVIKNLNLQGCITSQKKEEGLLRQLWNVLRVEGYNSLRCKEHPYSSILDQKLPLFSSPFIQEKKPLLAIKNLSYASENYTTLTLTFIDEKSYAFSDQEGKKIGEGHLDEPCNIASGSFTLARIGEKPLAGQCFFLSFIPLEEAALSLKNAVVIKADKTKPTLLHIFYTHSDRALATQIVNSLMDSYALYLKETGKAKIQNQLSYLSQRKEESLHDFEKTLKEFQVGLISNPCKEEGYILPTKEGNIFPPLESKFFATLAANATNKKDLLISEIKKWSQEESTPFSLALVKEKIQGSKQEIEADIPLFKVTSADQVKELLKRSEGDVGMVERLKPILLHFLVKEVDNLEKEITQLEEKNSFFDSRMIAEKRIALESELLKKSLESIGTAVEAKNIGFNLEIIESGPLEYAHVAFPDSPHLHRTALLFGAIFSFLYLFYLLIKGVYLGPSASLQNLRAVNAKVLGILDEKSQKELLRELLFHLTETSKENSKVILLSSQKESSFFHALFCLFPKEKSTHLCFSQEKNEFLNFAELKETIDSLKVKNQWIFLSFVGNPKSLEMRALSSFADEIIVIVQEGLLTDFDHLPPKTLHLVTAKTDNEIEEIPLRSLLPYVERLRKRVRDALLTRS